MVFLEKLKSIIRRRELKKKSCFLKLSTDSVYDSSFSVDLRHPQVGKKYLTVGSNCLIGGKFIFETETGEITVGNRCHIGNSMLISKSRISIGNDVTIAWGCTLYDHDSHPVDWEERKRDTIQEYNDMLAFKDPIRNKDWSNVNTKPIVIKDKAWIGMNVIILKGVTVGEGSVIAAGSVVTKDVAPWTVVAGNPARPVKYLEHRE